MRVWPNTPVASNASQWLAERLDESFMQGVTGWSMQYTAALF